MNDDFDQRVLQFYLMELPEQPQMMHMGTSYLIGDLYKAVKRLQARNEAAALNRPLPTHITRKDGGDWEEFVVGTSGTVHAIKFANGDIWDAYNGWRVPRT